MDTTTKEPDSRCTFANNTLGSCECGKQLFINDECSKVRKIHENIIMRLLQMQGFYCMQDYEFPSMEDAIKYDGCEIECNDDEILLVDPRNGGDWQCIPRLGPMPLICPGGFHTGLG